MEFNRIEINQGISPNMSPIPNENIFQEVGSKKLNSSADLFMINICEFSLY